MTNYEYICNILSSQLFHNLVVLAAVITALVSTLLAQRSQTKALAVDINFRALPLRQDFLSQFESSMNWLNGAGNPPFKYIYNEGFQNWEIETSNQVSGNTITYDMATSLIEKAQRLFPDHQCQKYFNSLQKNLETWQEISLKVAQQATHDTTDFNEAKEIYSENLKECIKHMHSYLDIKNFYNLKI